MLANDSFIVVVATEVCNFLISLYEKSFGCLVDFVAFGFIQRDNCLRDSDVTLEISDCQIVHDHACERAVVVSFTRIFKRVAAEKEFTNVTARIVLNHKFAARVLIHKLIALQDQVINYYQELAVLVPAIKFFKAYFWKLLRRERNENTTSALMKYLKQNYSAKEQDTVKSNQRVLFWPVWSAT